MTHPTDALRLVPVKAMPQQLEAAAFNLSAEIGAAEAMKLGTHIELAYELLVAAAPASPLPGGGWQDISTAPKDGAWYIVGCWVIHSDPQCREDDVCEWSSWAEPLDGGPIGCDGRYGDEATHWQPMPAPPPIPRDTIADSDGDDGA